MMGAVLLSIMYAADDAAPSVVEVLAVVTNLIVAPLATAPDHSTSRVFSVWSPALGVPGSAPLTMTVGAFAGRPKAERKVATSVRLISLRPAIAIVWPVPSMPAFHSGRTL